MGITSYANQLRQSKNGETTFGAALNNYIFLINFMPDIRRGTKLGIIDATRRKIYQVFF
jgi:hypothetical protein